MVSRKVLKDLLEKPLGPYRDNDILHEAACQMESKTYLALYSFVLEHTGRVTGLDESENQLKGRPNKADDRKFRFRGVLTIANPKWLSEKGLKTVETELNQRAKERALHKGERAPYELTLEDLFDRKLLTRSHDATRHKEDDTRLTVLIQGERNLPAVYMQSKRVPHGLLWNSKAHNRQYEIVTMDVETYAGSQNFFWRYRLWALMQTIAKKHGYVPPVKRTPMWFVNKYLNDYACPEEDGHQRMIFDDDDPDVDENGQTVTPRHLLRPHTSEIQGMFGAHAGWLITQNEVERVKLFDIASWRSFRNRVRREKKEAREHGVRWGSTGQSDDEEDGDSDNDGNGDDDDDENKEASEEDMDSSDDKFAERLAREYPMTGKSKEEMARKIKRGLDGKNHRAKGNESSDAESEIGSQCEQDHAMEYSDQEENVSEYDDAVEEALDRISWQLRQPPLLPDVDGRWWCPLPSCNYEIDLHDLKEEEGREIPEAEYILQKQWRNPAYDSKVVQGFGRMVSNHYLKHFAEQGVRLDKKNGKERHCSPRVLHNG